MSNNGPVLVLGGGLYQLPLIEAVKQRGLRSVVFDGDAKAPGLKLGDEGRVVDISDADAVLAAARTVRPRAIASIATEVTVRSGAAVAAALGLPGLSLEAARAATDKFVMRQKFAEAGLASPRFGVVSNLSEAERVAATVGYPLVVKPVDSSGSRGVARVDDPSTLGAATAVALKNSRDGKAILESFIDGVECTIEAFAFEGRVEIHGISDKVRVPFPHCVSVRLTYPPAFEAPLREAIADAARRAVTAVGIVSGPAHVEVMVTPSGPVLVEVAARGGGYRIFSDIIRELSGVDAVNAVLDLALGLEPSIRPSKSRAAVLGFFNPSTTGLVRQVRNVDEARRIPGVLDIVIDSKPGSRFRGITRDGERPGFVITVADTRAEAVAAADMADRMVEFDIDPSSESEVS